MEKRQSFESLSCSDCEEDEIQTKGTEIIVEEE